MSYVKLNPSYYQMFQPEGAWHAGAEGWSVAPYPGWGENPALVGPKRLGVEGLGLDVSAACDCSGDKALGAIGGVVFGGITAGLIVYLMGK